MHFFKLILILFLTVISSTYAWDGYDSENNEYVEIDKGNLVRSGRDIEVYHCDCSSYVDEEVISVNSYEVETYNPDTGEYHTYDMD